MSLRYASEHLCGATLITPNRALTAAQCRIPTASLKEYTLLAGSQLINPIHISFGSVTTLSKFILHPNFSTTNSKHFDIAVLWLDDKLPLSRSLNTLKLPKQNAPVPFGEMATVSGWGYTFVNDFSRRRSRNPDYSDVLQTTQVRILHNQECNGRSLFRSTIYNGRVNDQMICAGDRQGDSGVCTGDEGGALVVDKTVVGIVSWAGGCARPSFLATYTRVSSFSDWIESVLG